MISLRRQALIWMTAMLAALGVAAFFLAYELARGEAADFLDGQLRQIALNVGQGLNEVAAPPNKQDPEDEFSIEIWDVTGKPLRKPADAAAPQRQERLGFSTVRRGDEDWRIYLASDGTRTVQVAQRVSVRDELAQSAALQAGVPILVAIPLAWLVIGWSLGQVMGRLTSLAQAIATKSAESKEEIATDGVPQEVLPLVVAMNDLIVRLQTAIEKQKRFVSDAAHQLRTPLAAVQIQVGNMSGASDSMGSQAVSDIRDGVRRASAMVEQLLRMARLEESHLERPLEEIELSELVKQCVADVTSIAEAGQIDLGIGELELGFIQGRGRELRMLFSNLLDNAIRYTPAGGVVDVSTRREGPSIVVEIVDSGCGIPPESLPRVFDRFFRAAPSQTEGSGLGLSIAAAIAERHGMRIALENRRDRSGLRVRVYIVAGRKPTINSKLL